MPEAKPADNKAAPPAANSPGAEGGAYEVLRARMAEQCARLREGAGKLNAKRKDVFGGMETTLAGSTRISTEHNCVPRDIRHIGRKLVIGYDVFLGLKKETEVSDVLAVYDFDGKEFNSLKLDFLDDPRFIKDFKEIFQYYKQARIWQIRNTGKHLLLVFRTGDAPTDIKVLRWMLQPDGRPVYVDNRGERDHVFPNQHDFQWTRTTRDQHVFGKHPHVSIKDMLFVECIGGDLTLKIENNTESGKGIYSEPVDDPDQSLDDAEISYAILENLILLKIRPFGEQAFRYFVFSRLMQRARRIDALGFACVRLPEGHGIIFPGGYYLQTGECREFAENVAGMEFLKVIKSTNGEDILYVFYHRIEGRYILLQYNAVRKECAAPLACHGYSLFPDGKLIIFKNSGEEASRSHAVQIWQTPFLAEGVSTPQSSDSYLGKIGNRDLINGISDSLTLVKTATDAPPSSTAYQDLVKQSSALLDRYHWLGHNECFGLGAVIKEIRDSANSIVDEFDKVVRIQRGTSEQIEKFAGELEKYLTKLRSDAMRTIDEYVGALAELRKRRGTLISLRELRYADLPRLQALEEKLTKTSDGLSAKTVEYLLGPEALAPYGGKLDEIAKSIEVLAKVADAPPIQETLDHLGAGLDLLGEMINTLKIDDATARTAIIEALSGVYSILNRTKAQLAAKRKELLGKESIAEFSAQFKLLGQGLANYISLCDTPEKCDEFLTRLLVQVEELEGRFSDFAEFIEKIAEKRDEIYNAFSSRKQALLDDRQRRAGALFAAADRILKGVTRRALTFKSQDELNGYFAGDPMVLKIGDTIEKLREIGDSVKADELQSRIKSTREEAVRTLRDKLEIFEDGANVVKFGKYRFSVNTEPLDVSIVLRDGAMFFHITGTDYLQPISDERLEKTRAFWDQELPSENRDVYRCEFLAWKMISDAEDERATLSLPKLYEAAGINPEIDAELALTPELSPTKGEASTAPAALMELIRSYSSELYDEGYARGIHDHDTALLLLALLRLRHVCGLLRFPGGPRAAAAIFWSRFGDEKSRALITRKAQNLGRMQQVFSTSTAPESFAHQIASEMQRFFEQTPISFKNAAVNPALLGIAAEYLFCELARENSHGFAASQAALDLQSRFQAFLKGKGALNAFQSDMKALDEDLPHACEIARTWLEQFLEESSNPDDGFLIDEVLGLVLTDGRLKRHALQAPAVLPVSGLLGQHSRIEKQTLQLRLDEFLQRVSAFAHETVPQFRSYQALRKELLDAERTRLRLDEFKPKTMSSFVRNRLINDVYLPLIGENFAKQMGETGAAKRTDLMGLLLLISPPGYGKTTIMEYVASRLGLTFVKINGPALGTHVVSVDPAEAPNATAREEIEKLNLAFEMGNNVMIYIDDIQHTNPEFLQKFISLCDAQRKIEGVYKGKTRTYDFRGKKVAVVMSGNPYTESGARFQIPDMLSNRADTYNLGDIIGGRQDLFELSYLENCLTSNTILRPIAARGLDDFYKFYDMAIGGGAAETDLSHDYSAAELKDIIEVIRKLKAAQASVLKVNKEYIYSASQKDEYRTEPPFKLQGSYRNMNKIAGKVLPVMTDDELQRLIADHYVGEAQSLAGGAEQNLLKLAEVLGRQTDAQKARWEEVKRVFKRQQSLGGAGDDKAAHVVSQLVAFNDNLEQIRNVLAGAAKNNGDNAGLERALQGIGEVMKNLQSVQQAHFERTIQALGDRPQQVAQPPVLQAPQNLEGAKIEIVNTLPAFYTNLFKHYTDTIEGILVPLLKGMSQQMKSNDELHLQVQAVGERVKKMVADLGQQRRRPRKGAEEEDVLTEPRS
ncbi:MAG TPA: DNA repair ATPase [Planctomycetota bacterium]|nr:DNA repair ATPase [Planctomycetota bacterium]